MRKYQEYDFILPIYAICYIVNNDPSSLEDNEIKNIDSFIEKLNNNIGVGHFDFPSDIDAEKYFYYKNDIDGFLGTDVVDCRYIVFTD